MHMLYPEPIKCTDVKPNIITEIRSISNKEATSHCMSFDATVGTIELYIAWSWASFLSTHRLYDPFALFHIPRYTSSLSYIPPSTVHSCASHRCMMVQLLISRYFIKCIDPDDFIEGSHKLASSTCIGHKPLLLDTTITCSTLLCVEISPIIHCTQFLMFGHRTQYVTSLP